DQAIRGLLQLLGELFRVQNLADSPVGSLITLDAIYEIQKTALDSDTQASMARILTETASLDPMFQRAAKAVALLELVQDTRPTDARLVAQCLYDRVDRGNQVEEVTAALESLRQDNLLAWSEKLGYRIQSTAGEEWEREKREIRTPREAISEIVRDALRMVMEKPERPT
ncbi:MAG: BREX system P-loop protein BrxC, partial [Planctomyces sp.]